MTLGSRTLTLTYDSARAPWTSNGSNSLPGEVALSGDAGLLWWNSLHRQLYVSPNGLSLKASRGNGVAVDFSLQGNTWVAGADARTTARDQRDTLVASAAGFIYWDQASLSQEKYGTTGQMLNGINASGMSLAPTFTGNNLTKLSDPFGRNITLSYKSVTVGTSSQTVLDTITDPLGQRIVAGYDANANLSTLTWQDGPIKTLVYDSVNANQSWALTGIIDEASKRFATFGYDSTGRAISTEHAGGVNKYSVSWANGAGPQVTISEVYDQANNVVRRYHDWTVPQAPVVTSPTGTLETFNAPDLSLKYPRDTGRLQPAGAGCAASTSSATYDTNGNKASEDDFNGHRTCSAYSTASATSVGNLEITRVEGLTGGGNGTVCSTVVGSGASLPAGSRKISTAWHPQWALKTQQAEPLRKTTWVYNGQPDPFNNNQVANCASVMTNYGTSSSATLPDGSPIAVLCKKVEQATDDQDGSQGLNAPLSTADAGAVVQRQWSYTYNQYGQVLTSTDPQGITTTYSYYLDTSFTGTAPNEQGHTQGDLQSVSNPLGHTTTYALYDRAGRVLSMSDPNGLQTTYSYWPRGWIKSVNVGGLASNFDYWPTGLLKKATQPDGSYLYYVYDDAHRLTDITDQVDGSGTITGNRVHYTLDNAGNRLGEDVKDSSAALTRTIARTYDELNRLKTISGAAQ